MSFDPLDLIHELGPIGAHDDVDPIHEAESVLTVTGSPRRHVLDGMQETREAARLIWDAARLDGGRLIARDAMQQLGWGFRTPLAADLHTWGISLDLYDPWRAPDPLGPTLTPVQLDERGRILLPPFLRVHLGVGRTDRVVIFVSPVDRVLGIVAPSYLPEALGLPWDE